MHANTQYCVCQFVRPRPASRSIISRLGVYASSFPLNVCISWRLLRRSQNCLINGLQQSCTKSGSAQWYATVVNRLTHLSLIKDANHDPNNEFSGKPKVRLVQLHSLVLRWILKLPGRQKNEWIQSCVQRKHPTGIRTTRDTSDCSNYANTLTIL